MEHVVFYLGADGAEDFRRAADLEEAVRLVEHLRNDNGIGDVSVFALQPVPLAFRTYVHVELPPGGAEDGPVDEAEAGTPQEVQVAADELVVEEPVADELVADEPVADEPVADEPAAEELVAEEPVVDELVADEPAAEEPVAEEPVVDELVADEPAAEEPVAEEPAAAEAVLTEQVAEVEAGPVALPPPPPAPPAFDEQPQQEFVIPAPPIEPPAVFLDSAVAVETAGEAERPADVESGEPESAELVPVPDEPVRETSPAELPPLTLAPGPLFEGMTVETPVADLAEETQPGVELPDLLPADLHDLLPADLVPGDLTAPVADDPFLPPAQPETTLVAEEPVAEEPVAEEPVAEEPSPPAEASVSAEEAIDLEAQPVVPTEIPGAREAYEPPAPVASNGHAPAPRGLGYFAN